MAFAQAFSFELDPMCTVNDTIEDRVAEGGIADNLVPASDWDLAGDQQGAAAVAVIDDLQQISALLGVEWLRSPVVDDEQP